ncbi:MAG TPA: ATP-binding protein [Burkholderiales bacterium]|nr:ATP-binding protein [Burkholderiales bacterium]
MANSDHVKALIQSHLEGDEQQFYAVAMQLAAHEASKGHGKLAEEVREMIDSAKLRRSDLAHRGGPTPIGKPRGELAHLLDVSYPANRLNDMVLSASVLESLKRVIKEQRHLAKLRDHGLQPKRKLLLVGPPGTGKSMTAASMAGELGIPLYLVRLEALITKFMGETAAKLRQVFDGLASTRGVYFFDEFDAIGSQRGLTNDVGEARRILNSFLLMIEQDQSHSLIICATNHPEILDHALYRRFDDVIEYSLPDEPQIAHILSRRLARFGPPTDVVLKSLAQESLGLSHAEIVRIVDDAIKEVVMHDEKEVKLEDLQRLLTRRQRLRSNKVL